MITESPTLSDLTTCNNHLTERDGKVVEDICTEPVAVYATLKGEHVHAFCEKHKDCAYDV